MADAVPLNPRAGWLGIWPKVGWRGILDPENARIRVFLTEQAALLPTGCCILDAGAGKRPYKEIFQQHQYQSCDMPGGFYAQAHDFECWLNDIPKSGESYDGVLLTQVLEHVPDPEAVLRELARVLKPGGKLLLSVPMNVPLHGEPWHFFQFTHHGIAELARRTGFEVQEVEKVGGAFWQFGKRLPDAFNKLLKQYDPGRARKRGQSLGLAVGMTLALLPLWLASYPLAAAVIRPLCYWLDWFDQQKDFTLGYTAVLIKQETPHTP